MSLRKKIADSAWFNRTIEAMITGYVRFAHATSSWERTGFGVMEDVVRDGQPVIVALWHQRLIMSPYLFDARLGPMCTLTSAARAGRLAGQFQVRMGFDTIPMSSHKRHVALSREVLKRIKAGSSIGIAADGPRGPARISSTVPIMWARTSGCRIFAVTYSQRRVVKLPTWDEQFLPLPFSRGVLMCEEWTDPVPRKPSEEETEALRLSLQNKLDDLTDRADMAAGRDPDRQPGNQLS